MEIRSRQVAMDIKKPEPEHVPRGDPWRRTCIGRRIVSSCTLLYLGCHTLVLAMSQLLVTVHYFMQATHSYTM